MKSQLDKELDALLTPLGVIQELAENEEREALIVSLVFGEDIKLWQTLDDHFSSLRERYYNTTWKTHIIVNERYIREDTWVAKPIKCSLEQADIVLLGISVGFLLACRGWASYIMPLLQKTEERSASIIPVFLRTVSLYGEFSSFSLVPERAIMSCRDRDRACETVREQLEAVIRERFRSFH